MLVIGLILKAKHWNTRPAPARFQVGLASRNSPPMKMNGNFNAQAVLLVQEAYQLIRRARSRRNFLPEVRLTGIYDAQTAAGIARIQQLFDITVDGVAGAQTFAAMDRDLVGRNE